MNPFINPNKRSIQLPGGCKDLMDVLKHSEPKHRGSASKHDPASRGFTHLVLHRAYREQATELVIGVAPPIGGTPMKYKVADIWFYRHFLYNFGLA